MIQKRAVPVATSLSAEKKATVLAVLQGKALIKDSASMPEVLVGIDSETASHADPPGQPATVSDGEDEQDDCSAEMCGPIVYTVKGREGKCYDVYEKWEDEIVRMGINDRVELWAVRRPSRKWIEDIDDAIRWIDRVQLLCLDALGAVRDNNVEIQNLFQEVERAKEVEESLGKEIVKLEAELAAAVEMLATERTSTEDLRKVEMERELWKERHRVLEEGHESRVKKLEVEWEEKMKIGLREAVEAIANQKEEQLKNKEVELRKEHTKDMQIARGHRWKEKAAELQLELTESAQWKNEERYLSMELKREVAKREKSERDSTTEVAGLKGEIERLTTEERKWRERALTYEQELSEGLPPGNAPRSWESGVILHQVPCHYSIEQLLQDAEVSFARRVGVSGGRWLVGPRRRAGKATASVVFFLKKPMPIQWEDGTVLDEVKLKGQWYRVEPYDFNR